MTGSHRRRLRLVPRCCGIRRSRNRPHRPVPLRIASGHSCSVLTSTRQQTHWNILRALDRFPKIRSAEEPMGGCVRTPRGDVYALACIDDQCSVPFRRRRSAAPNQTGTIRIQVRAAEKPVEDAEVVVAGATSRTDAAGTTTVVTVPGTVEVTVVKAGFVPATATVQVAAGANRMSWWSCSRSRPSRRRSPSWRQRAPTSGSRISRCASRCWRAKRSKRRCS